MDVFYIHLKSFFVSCSLGSVGDEFSQISFYGNNFSIPLLNDFFLERSLELLKKKIPILTFQVPLAATSNASGVGAVGFEWLRKISSKWWREAVYFSSWYCW